MQTGRANSDYIIIESGLDEDDTVALTDPTVMAKRIRRRISDETYCYMFIVAAPPGGL